MPVPSSLSTGVIAMALLTPFRKYLFAKVLWDSGMQTQLAIGERDPGACPHVATAKAETPDISPSFLQEDVGNLVLFLEQAGG